MSDLNALFNTLRQTQDVNYIHVAIFTAQIYDILLSLSSENEVVASKSPVHIYSVLWSGVRRLPPRKIFQTQCKPSVDYNQSTFNVYVLFPIVVGSIYGGQRFEFGVALYVTTHTAVVSTANLFQAPPGVPLTGCLTTVDSLTVVVTMSIAVLNKAVLLFCTLYGILVTPALMPVIIFVTPAVYSFAVNYNPQRSRY
ncbi:hypothetical protein BDQ17DRAFT_1323998 [Cyathus striatus]|nr:hypothetical protein BDQ17DRAFT_1323998 [Cyathus striatus]